MNHYEVKLSHFDNDLGRTPARRELQGQRSPEDIAAADRGYGREEIGAEPSIIDEVIFKASPSASEERSAEYVDEALPGPAGIVVYTRTANRRFNISGKFISRNKTEAELNFRFSNLLRAWMIPQNVKDRRFGKPPILRLNGYKNQFFNIPVVLANLTISFPEDVDYIETGKAMVPIIQSVELSLIESHGTLTFEKSIGRDGTLKFSSEFDLKAFKEGRLRGY